MQLTGQNDLSALESERKAGRKDSIVASRLSRLHGFVAIERRLARRSHKGSKGCRAIACAIFAPGVP